ncbi:MAG: S8 family peptidase [Parcubacteria group bacterium]|nr:S8 family peptidase [Parcubacteria group bacterium]
MYTLLIPRKSSLREKKTGRGGPFWETFWSKKVKENPDYYKSQYESRLKKLNTAVKSFNTSSLKQDKKYYVEAKLDELATSKSSEPSMLWKEAGVQIVESREDGTLTLSGLKADFDKLTKLLNEATFESAAVEKAKKANNLSREIFSVTALTDKNTSIDRRSSGDIKLLLASQSNSRVDCILTVYFDRSKSEYDDLYKILISKVNSSSITKIDERFFISNMSFRASLDKSEIKIILEDEDCNFINFIKLAPIFGSQRTTPNTDARSITLGSSLTDEKVVIIDSGVDHQIMNGFVVQRENFLKTGQMSNKNHGTSVASRILFGDNLFKKVQNNQSVDSVGKIIDVQALHKNGNDEIIADDQTIMDAIQKSVRKYSSQATLFNLSLADHKQIEELDISETSEMIDTLANEEDVLFVCASGNQNGNFPLGYNKIFNTPGVDCHIAAPADAINALTVGSITDTADTSSICDQSKHPSPFTRKGGLRNDMKKPEIVAVGGNIKIDSTHQYGPAHLEASKNTYGVELVDSNGFNREVGSSFSAPLVTRQCLQLLDYLKKSSLPTQLTGFNENKANLIKALMIHSTSRVSQSQITDDGLKRAYGFGQADYSTVLIDNPNQITVVYADKISFSEKKQKILINLPKSLLGKKVEFTFTLVYNPPVNRNFKEYKMIELDPSLSFIKPELTPTGSTGKTKSQAINPPHSWEAYRNSTFNTIHFTKIRPRLTQLDFQVLVQMMIADQLLQDNAGNEEDITQNYALVLTIKDISASGTLHSEIINSNQFFELVENTVQVQSTN